MPKVEGTRQQRATKLLERIQRGPSIAPSCVTPLTEREVSARYRAWAESWILEDIINLIPELRTRKAL